MKPVSEQISNHPYFAYPDTESIRAQNTAKRLVASELALLVTAALLETGHGLGLDFGGWWWDRLPVMPLLAYLAVNLLPLRRPVLTRWYVGRAMAETSKGLLYRFTAGGAGMEIDDSGTDETATITLKRNLWGERDHAFTASPSLESRLERSELGSAAGVLRERAALDGASWPDLQAARGRPLADRVQDYITERIIDQKTWYETKSTGWKHQVRRMRHGSIAVAAGMTALLLIRPSAAAAPFLVGMTAAALGAGEAWVHFRQGENLKISYQYAADELDRLQKRAQAVLDQARLLSPKASSAELEERWAAIVDATEDAVSREHTSWRASVAKLPPAETPTQPHPPA